ncbi:TonB-dependent receptor [Granulicella sibirica]|nr:TonB-dependent receptor [Granulicella sibirica]
MIVDRRSPPAGRSVLHSTMSFLCTGGALLLCIFSLATQNLYAQNTTADVVGTATDVSGAVIAGASVVLTDVDTQEKRTLVTNDAGQYAFTLLKPSHYSLTITSQGFKTATIASFNLSAGDRAREDAHLVIGGQDQVVEVEAQAPALQSDSSVMSNTVTETATQELPLNGRNFYNLVQITAGATEGLNNGLASGNRPDDRRLTSSVSVNGQADVINNQLIDGMDNNERVIGSIGVRPAVDAIQEVNIQTNTFTAESGRSAGAIINVITKSGTNQLHGTLYEFFRNTVLNANPYKFGQAIPKPAYRQNQYGGSIGGPILKDRTFFFGDYEGFRLSRSLNPTQTTVPTAFERASPGNFTDNPALNTTVTPTDKAGLAYFNLFPLPTSTAFTNNYTATPSNTQVGDTVDGRVDHRFSTTDFGFIRYTFNRLITNVGGLFPTVTSAGLSISPGGNLSSYAGPAKSLAHQVQFNYIHTFTPNLLLELKAGYTFLNNLQNPLNFGTAPNTAFGQQNINFSSRTNELSPVTISQGATLGGHPPIVYLENTWQYVGAVSWTHGKQTIKLGGGVIRRQDTTTQTDSASGSWTIANFTTLLTGTYTSLSRTDILFQPHNRTWEPHAYVQDDWHVAQNLTLNLGIRYDLYTPYTDTNNILSNFDTDQGKLVVAGSTADGHGNVRVDYSNIAPRVGFALTPMPKTVIRGGFGMSFAPENLTSGSALVNQPFNSTIGPCSTTSPCDPSHVHFGDGLPVPVANSATNPTGAVAAALDTHFKSTYIEQFNLTVEREFGGNVATLSYVGELGRRLAYYLPDVNPAIPNSQSFVNPSAATLAVSTFNYNTLRAFYGTSPGITQVPYFTSKGISSYNALQAVLKRRLTKGLDFAVTYTYAHNLDDAETISNDGGDGFGSVPSLVPQLEYGNANLDVRHRGTGAFNYTLPFGNDLTGYRGLLAKGWQFNGLVVLNTGLPFSITNIANRSGTRPGSANTDRPNQIANAHLDNRTVTRWFNTAAYVGQVGGTVGNERRDQVSGPGLQRVDLSLFKIFPLTERVKMEFRTEAFNVMNTAQFPFPNASLGNSAFGTISSTANAYNPRILQFAVRFKF